jgi:hypothetical protein
MALGPASITTSSNGTTASGTTNIVTVAPGLFAANADGQGVAAAVVLRVRAGGGRSFESATRFDSATNGVVAVSIDLGAASDQVFGGGAVRLKPDGAGVVAEQVYFARGLPNGFA